MTPAAPALSSLDELVALIEKHTTLAEVTTQLIPALKKQDKSAGRHAFDGHLGDGTDPLQRLDAERFSVGYLFILNARLSAKDADLASLTPQVTELSVKFDPQQLRLVPEQVSFFAKTVIALSEQAKNTSLALLPLKALVVRLAPKGVLTAYHSLFLQTVLSSREYAQALDVLAVPIVDVDTASFPIKYLDHLTYHYLGGTVAALVRDFRTAVDLLEICVSAPGTGVSAVQVDAYKKLVLVQLLLDGKPATLPSYTSSAVTQVCKSQSCAPYVDYAAAYATLDRARVLHVAERGGEVFEKDFNAGLVHLCTAHLRRRSVQQLTATFIALSLADIAQHLGVAPADEDGMRECEALVLDMLATKEIHGALSRPSPTAPWDAVTVTFTDDPEPYDSHATVQRVSAAIAWAEQNESRARERDWELARGKEFVQKAYNASGSAGAMGGLGGGGGDEDVAMGRFDWDAEEA